MVRSPDRLTIPSAYQVSAYRELEELGPPRAWAPQGGWPGNAAMTCEMDIGAIREMGYRRVGNQLVPWVHAAKPLRVMPAVSTSTRVRPPQR